MAADFPLAEDERALVVWALEAAAQEVGFAIGPEWPCPYEEDEFTDLAKRIRGEAGQ